MSFRDKMKQNNLVKVVLLEVVKRLVIFFFSNICIFLRILFILKVANAERPFSKLNLFKIFFTIMASLFKQRMAGLAILNIEADRAKIVAL